MPNLTKKILVIGSNSFSGSNFINYLLNKKLSVIGISRRNQINHLFLKYYNNPNKNRFFKFFRCDLNKNKNIFKKIIKKYKPSIIINFSAQGMVEESWSNPNDWYKTNILSQVDMVNLILKHNKNIVKFLHFSTPEVYGSITKPTKENIIFNPSTPYAISRATFDSHLINLCKFYKFPSIITRTANVYGEHQPLYRIIPRAIMSKLLNIKMNLHGGGISKRSFIHIDDVCEALYLIMMKGEIGKSYHISSNKFISIDNLVSKIFFNDSEKKKKLIKYSIDRKGKDFEYRLDSSLLRKKFKWK